MMKINACLEKLETGVDYVMNEARKKGVSRERFNDIHLVFEELFVNICHYGYKDRQGFVVIECRVNNDGCFELLMRDTGIPFDMTAKEDPDLTEGVENRQPGGLGIFLVKKLTKAFTYERCGEENVVRVVF